LGRGVNYTVHCDHKGFTRLSLHTNYFYLLSNRSAKEIVMVGVRGAGWF